ncbi:PREDICTED: zinc-finger homeodomain protein 4-like [Ipomoea nil]|uniref:zinc-finger homeodomain protein 4-like n=1 Tax=Ipomoea nil TaxID=35883 RepID=UPI000901D67A|nr:PREDICTED: zinc-finger homeodomain protein 4-like [Ipomoea nil]
MSQENKKPLLSAAGNASCSKHEEEEEHNNVINAQMVPFVASSSAMEVIETHKPYCCNRYNDVKYMECLKNHAAAMGGTATDGCGEFMPAGEDGSLEALKCSACQCHRNFHRKLIIKGCPWASCSFTFPCSQNKGATPPLAYNNNNNTSSGGGGGVSDWEAEKEDAAAAEEEGLERKKRFRTKFSGEQKEKMVAFAERVGWKIQNAESSVVHHFCQEIGVKRRVLKVWMHNNKNNFAAQARPTN